MLDFESNFDFFKVVKTYINDRYVLPIWNMGVTDKKYGVLVYFYCKQLFSIKPNANTVGF
jgi:hypothetical protein